MSDQNLLAAAGAEAILIERLKRPGLSIKVRGASLAALAAKRKSNPAREALAILKELDAGQRPATAADDIGYLLASLPRADLVKSRATFAGLAAGGKRPPVRRAAYAAVVAGDGEPGAIWAETSGNRAARTLLIDSIGLHPDAAFRAAFAPLLEKLARDTATPAGVRHSALLALPLLGTERAGSAFRLLADNLRAGR